jgi:hypothetical protein
VDDHLGFFLGADAGGDVDAGLVWLRRAGGGAGGVRAGAWVERVDADDLSPSFDGLDAEVFQPI